MSEAIQQYNIQVRTLPLSAYCKMMGLSRETINRRVERGIWQLGKQVIKVGGSKERYVDLKEIDEWVLKNKEIQEV